MSEDLQKKLEELIEEEKEANIMYRVGNPVMSDSEYDQLVEDIESLKSQLGDSPVAQNHKFTIGHSIPASDERMERLPIKMASMEKCKTVEEILKWRDSNDISDDETVVLSPKYDGIALCRDEELQHSWTRGDGVLGQRSDAHFAITNQQYEKSVKIFSFGELIMPRDIFENQYSMDVLGEDIGYANARNMVSGKINEKVPSEELKDCVYVRYGMLYKDAVVGMNKSEQLRRLNLMNKTQVPYEVVKASDLNDELLFDLFDKWGEEFEIDGIIIDLEDSVKADKLGRNSKGNPNFAVAYKNPLFSEVKETTVLEIEYNISQQGFSKPIIHIEPVRLDGVTVRKATGYNAKFIKNIGLSKGTKIKITRSGMVIPKVIEVEGVAIPSLSDKKGIREAYKLRKGFESDDIPTHCNCCGTELEWNETGVELTCYNPECPDQLLERVISFFSTLGVDNMGEGNVKAFFDAGYDSIKKILDMSKEDMEKIDRFGKKKSKLIHNSIHSKMKEVKLPKLQHALGFFGTLGSKKLALVEGMEEASAEELLKVEGFAEKSVEFYQKGLLKFNEYMAEGLPITIADKKVPTSDKFKDKVVVFSGIRNSEWEKAVEDGGGKVTSSVSKKTTLLVMKVKGTGSGKEKKAIDLGVEIMDANEFENIL